MSSESKESSGSIPKHENPIQVYLKDITFSDDTTVELAPDSITIIVGPNNSGKTTCLNNIAKTSIDGKSRSVVKNLTVCKIGSADDLVLWLGRNTFRSETGYKQLAKYSWMKSECDEDDARSGWNQTSKMGRLATLMVSMVSIDNRLRIVEPAEATDIDDSPEKPIHVLLKDEHLENTIGKYFRDAFRQDLILCRGYGKHNCIHFGAKPTLLDGEDRVSSSYLDKLRSLPLLHEAGHGMRSFVGCILNLFASPALIQLIDEPEAFLHPPQARLLGTLLAHNKPANAQLIIATHSSDFIRGVIDSGITNVKVIRITREADINYARQLDAEQMKSLWSDPILRFSNIFDGLFHELVVVCEGDPDCRFYAAVADAIQCDPMKRRDVLFTWTNGKHRLPTVVAALHSVGVPTRIIADFDILNEQEPLQKLSTILNANWDTISKDRIMISKSIESKFIPISVSSFKENVDSILASERNSILSENAAEKIKNSMKSISPWAAAKLAGIASLPNGEATERTRNLLDELKNLGLFIVECGELERFVPSIGNKGPKWVAEVLASKNLTSDSELKDARDFISQLLSLDAQSIPTISVAKTEVVDRIDSRIDSQVKKPETIGIFSRILKYLRSRFGWR